MENQILLKESSESEIRRYFNAVLELSKSDNEFPINLDEVWMLVYARKDNAVRELKDNFIKDVDYRISLKNEENSQVPDNQSLLKNAEQNEMEAHEVVENVTESSQVVDNQMLRKNAEQDGKQKWGGGSNKLNYYLTVSCMEFLVARKNKQVFEVYRQVFHKVANQQFYIPQTYKQALLLAYKQAEKIEDQQDTINTQTKTISELGNQVTELREKADYVDTILSSHELITVTQIAQDYGMSAQKLNSILHEMGIQYKVGRQWILYSKYLKNGYVFSDTTNITHSDGRMETVMNTKWRQKGRLFLYEELKKRDIIPTIEKPVVEVI
jgi:phage antirepressor YoqD-like protein